MTKPLLLQAFDGTNETVPVWFMRQAGRYLPEYQAIRAGRPLEEMFRTPEIAAEVTCQPVEILGVDAAILFADILTLPHEMGFEISFDNKLGPIIGKPLKNIKSLNDLRPVERVRHIDRTIHLIKQQLPVHIPLIGFAGSPFTVLTYLIEGKSSSQYLTTLRFLQEERETFIRMMDLLTTHTITYLRQQIESGASAYQLFESAAGVLPEELYSEFVLPSVERIFREVNAPSIYFLRQGSHLLNLARNLPCDGLSLDHTVSFADIDFADEKLIQGNLFNGYLYAPAETLDKAVHQTLEEAARFPRYIFNLSHGVFRDVAPDALKRVVETVHAFPWKMNPA